MTRDPEPGTAQDAVEHHPKSVAHRQPLEVVHATLTLLADVEADVRWVHASGFNPARSTGSITTAPQADDENPDQVPGARHDIAVGDYACRSAFRAAVKKLAQAESHTHKAVETVDRHPNPVLLDPNQFASLATVNAVCAGIRWRLVTLAADLPHVDEVAARRVKRRTLACWSALNAAAKTLTKALSREHRPELDTTRYCAVCGIRPMAMRLKKLKKNQGWQMVPAKGGRCHTCAAWYLDPKHKGQERPRDLDSVQDAIDAQQRRQQRGEGWGEA